MRPSSECAILVPIGGQMDPETEDGLRVLAGRGYKVRTLRGSSMVDLARSTLASDVLAEGFEEHFWIDADTVFNPDDVDRIRAHGLPFCVGLYVQKGPKRFAGKFRQDAGKVGFGKVGGLVEMEYVGFGFTFVRREVYEAIRAGLPERERSCRGGYAGRMVTPYFRPLLVPEGDGLCYLSEDYSFTARATEAGFAPWADTTVKLGHAGRKVYTWDDLQASPTLDSLEIELNAVAGWTFPQDVRGWLTDEEGAGLALLARGKDVLEVGSYCGRSAICMGQTAASLCCVDPFDSRDTPGDGSTFEEFERNLKRYGVKARAMRSLFAEAPLNGDRFDLVFIDGAHDEASVRADATRAAGLLKPDGLLAFHDYRPTPGHHDGGWHPGVTHTVNRLIAQGAELVRTIGTVAVIRPNTLARNNREATMDEATLYAMLGKKQAQLEAQDAAYSSLLQLTASIVSGTVDPSRVLIDMTNRSWATAPPGQRPPLPATINGSPVCVVAPEKNPGKDPEIESLAMSQEQVDEFNRRRNCLPAS